MKILVVDDDKDVAQLIAECIAPKATEVQVAYNGAEALEIYKEFLPDIILTDITMPVMDGITMATKVKELNNSTKIIVFTANSDSYYLEKAKSSGIKYFLNKPINFKKLMEYIEQ